MSAFPSAPTGKAGTVYLKDYTPPPYRIEAVHLWFDLGEETTHVLSRLHVRRAPGTPPGTPLALDGRDVELVGLKVDDAAVLPGLYRLNAEQLILPNPPEEFVLEVETRIHPARNHALEGLFLSGKTLCTQCEAEGFRHLTYYPDRPDILARFTVTLTADEKRFPVLLSNGNLASSGRHHNGRHWATWDDPHPKPSYLFALVAGDLACHRGSFTTASGRVVTLDILVEPQNRHKCAHALASLQKAMAWDEATFGLEYDLDTYMVVAVDDFNMGAMENKGLNIFNSKYVLADPASATDNDFEAVESVIAHEYFHNWTGNRVTLRDWFQLSLKEGLTVFRDQYFSETVGSKAVARAAAVRVMQSHQFPEDDGPASHPVRPESYQQINNFYTTTVYEKGACVCRMLHTLLGAEAFRAGLGLYLARHDGQAVTVEDFLAAMSEVSGRDLTQFLLWYRQAGTPRLTLEEDYDAALGRFSLTIRQETPATPGQPDKQPLHIPFRIALLAPDGHAMPLTLQGETFPGPENRVLEITRQEERFVFEGILQPPVLSPLRDFSAPVRLKTSQGPTQWAFLLAHDSDPVNRWMAGREMSTAILMQLAEGAQNGRLTSLAPAFLSAFTTALLDRKAERRLIALTLAAPEEGLLAERQQPVDVESLHLAREHFRREVSHAVKGELLATYQENLDSEGYRITPEAMGQRALKNLCLDYLSSLENQEAESLLMAQYEQASNMTDSLYALRLLLHDRYPGGEEALADFLKRHQHDAGVMDKWFAVQATIPGPHTLQRVESLLSHPLFSLRNPNKVRALLGSFAHANPTGFHRADGLGHHFIAAHIRDMDGKNPQLAVSLLRAFARFRRHEPHRQQSMLSQLQGLAAMTAPSSDLREMVGKFLA